MVSGETKWIGDRRRPIKGEPPCPFLRRSFSLPGPVRRATLHWTALGVADVFPAYRGKLSPKVNEAVRVTQTLRPRKITEPEAGKYVFDFGQNIAGVCRLKIRGRRGQKVTLKFAEMLNADGTVYRENLRLARATDTYFCRGGGVEEWTPRFTFHGFRYVEVTGLDKKPSSDLLTALVLHTDMQATGKFRCSNPLLNRLDRNISWGLRGNFLDVPTDCPQRDERPGAELAPGASLTHRQITVHFTGEASRLDPIAKATLGASIEEIGGAFAKSVD
jgi:hypothetical protein